MEDIKIMKEKIAIKKMKLQIDEFDIRVLELGNEIEKVKESKASYVLQIEQRETELEEKLNKKEDE